MTAKVRLQLYVPDVSDELRSDVVRRRLPQLVASKIVVLGCGIVLVVVRPLGWQWHWDLFFWCCGFAAAAVVQAEVNFRIAVKISGGAGRVPEATLKVLTFRRWYHWVDALVLGLALGLLSGISGYWWLPLIVAVFWAVSWAFGLRVARAHLRDATHPQAP